MLVAINGAVREKFRICVGVAEIKGVTQDNESRKRIDAELRRVEVWARQQFDLKGVKDAGKIRAQRDFFWRMGVDPKEPPCCRSVIKACPCREVVTEDFTRR